MNNEKQFFNMLEIYPAPTIVHDTRKFVFVNSAFVKMIGASSKQELLGRDILDIVHSSSLSKSLESLSYPGRLDVFELRDLCLVRMDGSIIYVDVSGTHILMEGHDYINIIFNDITTLRMNEERYHSLFELSPEGIILQDEKGCIIDANPKAVELTGFSLDELVGNNIAVIASHADKSLIDSNLQKILSGEILRQESFASRKDGTRLNVQLTETKVPLPGGKSGILTLIADITERKANEQLLIKAKKEAEEMSSLKSSFLLNMSHELRTPMIGVIGFAEILSEYKNDPEIRSIGNRIFASSTRLLETLKKIMDFSRIEAGRSNPVAKEFELIDSVIEVCKTFEYQINNSNLYLRFGSHISGCRCLLDKSMFVQALENLISNAIKFTFHGGVTVNLWHQTRGDKKRILISVTDTGIGIDSNDFEIIFQAFRQASEGMGRHFEGTGLGLTIAKNHIEKMGGTISVNSTPGKGSIFTISLPLENNGITLSDGEQILYNCAGGVNRPGNS